MSQSMGFQMSMREELHQSLEETLSEVDSQVRLVYREESALVSAVPRILTEVQNRYNPGAGQKLNPEKVMHAVSLSYHLHGGIDQKLRESKSPYIAHEIQTAVLTVIVGLSAESTYASLTHEIIEDDPETKESPVKLKEDVRGIQHTFGEKVALHVLLMAKDDNYGPIGKEREKFSKIRMLGDIDLIIEVTCDTIVNMTQVSYLGPKDGFNAMERQTYFAMEKLHYVLPLARAADKIKKTALLLPNQNQSVRLGLSEWLSELISPYMEQLERYRQFNPKFYQRVQDDIFNVRV